MAWLQSAHTFPTTWPRALTAGKKAVRAEGAKLVLSVLGWLTRLNGVAWEKTIQINFFFVN